MPEPRPRLRSRRALSTEGCRPASTGPAGRPRGVSGTATFTGAGNVVATRLNRRSKPPKPPSKPQTGHRSSPPHSKLQEAIPPLQAQTQACEAHARKLYAPRTKTSKATAEREEDRHGVRQTKAHTMRAPRPVLARSQLRLARCRCARGRTAAGSARARGASDRAEAPGGGSNRKSCRATCRLKAMGRCLVAASNLSDATINGAGESPIDDHRQAPGRADRDRLPADRSSTAYRWNARLATFVRCTYNGVLYPYERMDVTDQAAGRRADRH